MCWNLQQIMAEEKCKDDKISGKTLHVPRVEDLISLRWQCCPGESSDSHNPYQNQMAPLQRVDKVILMFIWKCSRCRIARTVSKEKNIVKRLTLSNFKTSHKAVAIKTVLPAYRQTWIHGIELRVYLMHLHIYGQLFIIWAIEKSAFGVLKKKSLEQGAPGCPLEKPWILTHPQVILYANSDWKWWRT